jgi:predicted porin
MKKTLIALAVMTVSGAAFAQSSVTMYGNIDMATGTAVTKSASGLKDTTAGVVDGVMAPNRIGFRGVEDMGGGLKAGFVLEQGIAPTSSNGFNARVGTSAHQTPMGNGLATSNMRAGNAYVSGGFGEVRIGTQNRSAYSVSARSIVMAENFGGEGHALAGTRTTAISYTSPAFSGVTLQFQTGGAHGERTTVETSADNSGSWKTNKTTISALSLNYVKGPLWAGLAYESTDTEKIANGAATTNFYGGTVSAGTAVAARNEKLWAAGVSYDFGVAKVNLTTVQRDQVAAGKADSVNLSATVPVGAIELGAISTTVNAESSAGVATSKVTGYQVGAKYHFSKRTYAYVWSGHDKDSLAASTALADRTRTVAGVQHSF